MIKRSSFPLLLSALALAGCPGTPTEDAGTPVGGDGKIIIDGAETAYTIDSDASSLVIVVPKRVKTGCPSFFHSHAVEAESFALEFNIDEGDPSASTLTATVAASGLSPDAADVRARFDETSGEELADSLRGQVKVSVLGEIDAENHPTMTFAVSGVSGLEAGADGAQPNTADVAVTIAGQTATVPMTFSYVADGDKRVLSGQGVLDGTAHGMPRDTDCYTVDSLPLHLELTLVPGENNAVLDAGDVEEFEPTVFPYAGDCVDKIAFNAVRDVAVRRCSGCHAATPQYGATSSLVTYENFRTDTARNPGVPAFEAMRTYLLEEEGHPIMPPNDQTPLAQDELNLLVEWIDQGGPDCNDGTTPTTFTPVNAIACDDTVNYQQHIMPFISVWCGGCHDTTQDTLPIFIDDFTNGATETGHPYYQPLTMFEVSLLRMEDGTMPPFGGVQQTDLDTFSAWIAAGYPEEACN